MISCLLGLAFIVTGFACKFISMTLRDWVRYLRR